MRIDADFVAEAMWTRLSCVSSGLASRKPSLISTVTKDIHNSHKFVLDDMLLRVDIDINDGSLVKALNMVSLPVKKRRLDHIHLHSVGLLLHEHRSTI